MEFFESQLDLPIALEYLVDCRIGSLRAVERLLERVPLDRLTRAVQVRDGALQVDPDVRRGDELLTRLGDHADDALELDLLEGLEALLRELRSLPVIAFPDRRLRAGEGLLGRRRIGAERAGVLEEAREVRDLSLEGTLERLLRLRAALPQGVVRLLEVEVRDVPAGPFDQGRRLRRVRPEL